MSEHSENKGYPVAAIAGFLGLSAVVIAVAIAKKTGAIDYDVAKRCVGVVFGLMLIWAGNLVPKFRLFGKRGSDPARSLAAERFAGWTLALVGAAYAAVWGLAPMANVTLISSIIGLAAFAVVAALWLRSAGSTASHAGGPHTTETTLAKRILLGTLLVSLGWGIAIFLIDHFWGDKASQWAAVAYAIVVSAAIGLITTSLACRRAPLDK